MRTYIRITDIIERFIGWLIEKGNLAIAFITIFLIMIACTSVILTVESIMD